jgi:sugar O-acyltransferase (sialic acid O-acetyltransferase NeuD family)
MKDLLFFPFGGNARESLIAALAQNKIKPMWNIKGFIDDNQSLLGKKCCGVPVMGGKEKLKDFPSAQVIAVPGRADNFMKRKKIIDLLNLPNESFAIVIDPSARIAPDAEIGKNTVLMANVVASSLVKIGDHNIILPNTVIAHDSIIGDYSIIGSNVTISGGCNIGSNCYIGSGTSIKENIKIGNGSLIGMASNVVTDVSAGVVVAGNPARFFRSI